MPARHDAVRLVVGDQHLVRRDGEAVDLPGDLLGRRGTNADDRDLGARTLREQRRRSAHRRAAPAPRARSLRARPRRVLRAREMRGALPRRGDPAAARAAPAAAGARCGRARAPARSAVRRARAPSDGAIARAACVRPAPCVCSQSGTSWRVAATAAAAPATAVRPGLAPAPAPRLRRRRSSSIASGLSASLDQLVPAARRACGSRRASRRSPDDPPRASSPHRAGAGTRPRPRAPRPRARSRPARRRRPSARPRPAGPACRARAFATGSASMRGSRGPFGGVVVSARITIGASRPLAPCTVITRTSSRAISMSRFTCAFAGAQPCDEALQRRRLVRARRSARAREIRRARRRLPVRAARRSARGPRPRRECAHRTRTAIRAAPTRRNASSRACASMNSRSVSLRRAAQRAACPCAPWASAKSCSSVTPNSGLFSTLASARSSSRQQQRVGERHQVHHGDVLGQHQPVGARDLDAFASSARG